MQDIGVRVIEKEKIGSTIKIYEENIYEYMLDRNIASCKGLETVVSGPAWFYKKDRILKQLLKIKGC